MIDNLDKINKMEKNFTIYPKPGEIWVHYKGGSYKIVCLADHTDTKEPMVIYQSLSFGGNHARPLREWFDTCNVIYDSGEEYRVPRFVQTF